MQCEAGRGGCAASLGVALLFRASRCPLVAPEVVLRSLARPRPHDPEGWHSARFDLHPSCTWKLRNSARLVNRRRSPCEMSGSWSADRRACGVRADDLARASWGGVASDELRAITWSVVFIPRALAAGGCGRPYSGTRASDAGPRRQVEAEQLAERPTKARLLPHHNGDGRTCASCGFAKGGLSLTRSAEMAPDGVG